jgi:hypothetical protein
MGSIGKPDFLYGINHIKIYDLNYKMSVVLTHNAGFFSCCSIKLDKIVDYINSNLKIPEHIDSSKQFEWYKKQKNDDITYDFFEHYDNIKNIIIMDYSIDYNHDNQFIDYSKINYNTIIPIVKKYFSPSNSILNIIEIIEKKYNLLYDNICVLFYRGNDKCVETKLCNYDEYLYYANLILGQNPNIMFLIQSDETEFIEYMIDKFPNNSFYFKDEIRRINER